MDFRSDVNKRLDKINKRIDAINDSLNRRINEIYDSLSKRLDETNKRIEALNDSLSREISEVRDALNRRIGTLYNLLGKIYQVLIKKEQLHKGSRKRHIHDIMVKPRPSGWGGG